MRDPSRDGPAVRAGFEHRVEVQRLDVTEPAEVDDVVARTLERHGRIDVLINNAGYGLYGPAECGSEQQLWQQPGPNTVGPAPEGHPAPPSQPARHTGKLGHGPSL